jgi:peptidase E
MKRLFLASSIETTGPAVGREIGNPAKLKLAFIYTAGEPEEEKSWIVKDRAGLEKAGFNITDYTISGKVRKDIEKDLEAFDIIHVNGGDTFYFMLQARMSGFDKWIFEKVNKGEKIYTGSSAGSMSAALNVLNAIYFENYDYEKQLKGNYDGLGLVDFIALPHWGSEDFREKYLSHRMEVAYKPENKIILLNDWQYIKVVEDTYKIVDIRDNLTK